MIKNFKNQAGDTLVEVLLATVILSAVLSTAYTLSNRATKLNSQAFERTQVIKLLQQQAELVRSARDSYVPYAGPTPPVESKAWVAITTTYKQSGAVAELGTTCDDLSQLATSVAGKAFYIDDLSVVNSGLIPSLPLFKIWTEIGRGGGNKYWDVHVFGCWEALSGNPVNRTSIVLRLEDPA